MQKKKNIKLIVILSLILCLTIIIHFFKTKENTNRFDKNLLAFQQPNIISEIKLISKNNNISLKKNENIWYVNNNYKSDPQRVSLLMEIIKNIKIKRKISPSQENEIRKLFDSNKVTVEIRNENKLLESYEIAGDETRELTYFKTNENNIYLGEIPGYNNYLGSVFYLDENDWRYPMVFDINWINLSEIRVKFLENNEEFEIIFDNKQLSIKELNNHDSLKLNKYVDDISLLYVADYLNSSEIKNYEISKSLGLITVKDIAKNEYSLEIYDKVDGQNYLVKIDSLEYGLLNSNILKKVAKPKQYFIAK